MLVQRGFGVGVFRALVGVVFEDQAGRRKSRMLELEAVVDDGDARLPVSGIAPAWGISAGGREDAIICAACLGCDRSGWTYKTPWPSRTLSMVPRMSAPEKVSTHRLLVCSAASFWAPSMLALWFLRS